MNYLVPLGALGGALFLMLVGRMRRNGGVPAHAATPEPLRWLIHSINDDRCTGCDACVTACPTRVLQLVDHKARVVRFEDCVQCEKCVRSCPTKAMVMHHEGVEPPPVKVPELDPYCQTRTPGQYLIGEAAARPLVKNSANLGRLVVEHMVATGLQPGVHRDAHSVDVVIVGSGPSGLSAALTCMRRGLSYVVLEKDNIISSTVSSYPKGKPFLAEPIGVANLSYLPVWDCSKEQLISAWKYVLTQTRMDIRLGHGVTEVVRERDGFRVEATGGTWRAQRVVLAIGVRGKPRKLGVPGEDLPHVSSMLEDPDHHAGENVLVVGGGDVALEAAVALSRAGARVVLSYRGRNFNRAQKRNRSAVDTEAAAGRIEIVYKSNVTAIRRGDADLAIDGGETRRVVAQRVFVVIGADAPTKWLEKVGVRMVERPHMERSGTSDALIGTIVRGVSPCPDDPRAAVAKLLGRLSPAAMAAVPVEITDRPSSRRRVARGTPELATIRITGTPQPGRRTPLPPLPRARTVTPPPVPHAHGRAGTLSGLLRVTTGLFKRVEPATFEPLDDFDDDPTRIEVAPPPYREDLTGEIDLTFDDIIER